MLRCILKVMGHSRNGDRIRNEDSWFLVWCDISLWMFDYKFTINNSARNDLLFVCVYICNEKEFIKYWVGFESVSWFFIKCKYCIVSKAPQSTTFHIFKLRNMTSAWKTCWNSNPQYLWLWLIWKQHLCK